MLIKQNNKTDKTVIISGMVLRKLITEMGKIGSLDWNGGGRVGE